MVLRLPHTLRESRTIPTIRITRTRRNMLRVAVDPPMDLDMALITAIIVLMVRDIGVGLEGYLFHVEYQNSSAVSQYPSRCGFNRWSTIFLSQASLRGSM